MPKRKRALADQEGIGQDDPVGLQRKKATEKLHHSKKLVHRALKLAKGFERQKLGRRHKTALQSDAQARERIDGEIKALKALDLHTTAQTHLHKTMLKIKRMKESAALPEEVLSIEKPSLDQLTANVTARLFTSNPVKEAMAESVSLLMVAMALQDASESRRQDRAQEPGDHEKPRSHGIPTESDEKVTDVDASRMRATNHRLRSASFSGSELSDVDDSRKPPRLASCGSPSVPSSAMSTAASPTGPAPSHPSTKPSSKPTYDHTRALSLSPSPTPSRSASPTPPRKPQPATTSFLPTLTTGYVSGSSSDIESVSAPPLRKNRRGQRARQAIWEKKFGAKAKHLKAGAGAGATQGRRDRRDDGWDLQRGAVEEGADRGKGYRPGWARGKGDRASSGAMGSGGNAVAVASRKVTGGERPLHPSWEAKKRAKEKGEGAAAFQGKKMVFD
ncbi:MAG: hypothetical protein M1828_004090 [Chrysothrix sp. TS-e1954]|nr:MAG: hypothetical protein M1828_004090 [Chrysothrix sp. TS-e1954]